MFVLYSTAFSLLSCFWFRSSFLSVCDVKITYSNMRRHISWIKSCAAISLFSIISDNSRFFAKAKRKRAYWRCARGLLDSAHSLAIIKLLHSWNANVIVINKEFLPGGKIALEGVWRKFIYAFFRRLSMSQFSLGILASNPERVKSCNNPHIFPLDRREKE